MDTKMSTESTPSLHLPLKGKLAIVTGSSRGIGAAIALDLAKRGADIILTYNSTRSIPSIESLESEIRSLQHSLVASYQIDLSYPLGPKELINSIIYDSPMTSSHTHPLKIHILVNNAGVTSTIPLSEITPSDFSQIYNLNVRGTLLMTQAVLPYLAPSSRIINISSVGARSGFANHSLYCSSKAAMEGLTRSWARELGEKGITVNCVSPGPVESEMLDQIPESIKQAQREVTPLGKRIGRVDDIVGVVSMLSLFS
ncbi:hypothetical protein NHQ30_004843 [Ciborinia camelliae]|nr:hypothetical protein NHQ30_004843 [Ciborinia camelliae]